MLSVSADARLGDLRLDVALDVRAGECLALAGPSGAGKSSVLRVIAGLLPPDDGRVAVGSETWDDVPADVHVPAHERRLGMVFQDHLLFPHLSVTDNVAFGLRTRGLRKPVARAAAREWLARVGIAELGDRRRHASGRRAPTAARRAAGRRGPVPARGRVPRAGVRHRRGCAAWRRLDG